METIQIKIQDLKEIIESANDMKKYDSSLSDTIEITFIKECDTHLGNDKLQVNLKNSYSECNSKLIGFIK